MVSNQNKDKFDIEKLNIVKKYFSRIFTVLKPEIRHELDILDIPDQKKKELKKALAFLSYSKQKKYLKEIHNTYDEEAIKKTKKNSKR
ncbi:MAG: hypothetical protein JW891_09080 [Candidatus Lokiarchaeota archaeon]|nr:hypothetical protein [Candidatus Lokiarchaeota archaeon]